jgi:hypothetical protein
MNDLKMNGIYDLNVLAELGGGRCAECGTIFEHKGQAVYLGVQANKRTFAYVAPFSCDNCGFEITGYQERVKP